MNKINYNTCCGCQSEFHDTNDNVCKIDIVMATLQVDNSIKLSNHGIGNNSNNTTNIYGHRNNNSCNFSANCNEKIIQRKNGTNMNNNNVGCCGALIYLMVSF